jgi:hypothetical protein
VCQVLIQIAQGQRGHRRARVCRRGAHVRQHDGVVHLAELLWHIRFVGDHVEARTGEPSLGQQLHQSLLVDDVASGDVNQITVGAKGFQHVAAHQGRGVLPSGGRHHQHLDGFRQVHR